MRLVLKVARITAHHAEYGPGFARAVAELIQDGHFLIVIHGSRPILKPYPANASGNGCHAGAAEDEEFSAIERENRVLVSLLAEAKTAGIGLCATDAGLIQLRKPHAVNGGTGISVEAARMHSRWPEIICTNKGVPVVSNLACWAGEGHYILDPDQMAAVCAVDWNADALIYITEEDGVPGEQGGILRWFDINSNSASEAGLSDEMRSRLQGCAMALKRGVWRVRILPLSNVDCLSSFYFSSINYGTEIIAGNSHVEKSMAATIRQP